MKVLAKKFNISNGHVYAFIKMWELTSSTFCEYKNFEKHRKWMETKENLKSFKDAAFPIFLKDIGCLGRIELTLREKFPYSELFWSAFSHIWTEYG